jgi:hypothetical protein
MREGSGTQSIHIVDDDEAVRDSLAALVESAGLSAKAYASAIELLTSPGGLPARVVWQLIALWRTSACPRWMGLNSSRS